MRRKALLLFAGIAVVASAGCSSSAFGGTFDPKVSDLQKAVGAQIGSPVTVTCPSDLPLGAGKIADCVVSDSTGRKYLRLTQDDDQGHYRWEITPQDAP